MALVEFGRHQALLSLDEAATNGAKYASLHTAYSATGTNEVTGGSPAYARKALTWDAAASSAKALNANITFDVPASTTVQFVGFWDAVTAGNFLGMVPLGSGAPKQFVMPDPTTDEIYYSIAHGLADTNQIVLFGASVPTGATVGTLYYVISAATNSFKVSATSGGASLNVSAAGEGHVQRCIPETFGAQGTLILLAASTSLNSPDN